MQRSTNWILRYTEHYFNKWTNVYARQKFRQKSSWNMTFSSRIGTNYNKTIIKNSCNFSTDWYWKSERFLNNQQECEKFSWAKYKQ